MENKILNMQKNKWKNAKDIEEEISYGFDISYIKTTREPETKKQIKTTEIVNKTVKKLVVHIRIISKTQYHLIEAKAMKCIHINIGNDPKILCLVNEKTGDTYSQFGDMKIEEYSNEQSEKLWKVYLTTGQIGEKTMKEMYDRKVIEATELCSNFNIDATKCCYDERIICREIAYPHFKYIDGAQHISLNEMTFLDGSMLGAIMTAEKTTLHNAYKYDINSMYGYLMSHDLFEFPLRRGKVSTVSKIFKYRTAIYKLNIKGTHRFWKNTPNNFYTNYHIKLLNLLKIDYELVNEENNALIYEKGSTVDGCDVFEYMNELYELKEKGNKFAKLVMSCTWGEFSRKKVFEVNADTFSEDTPKNRALAERIVKYNPHRNVYILSADEKPFKYPVGRIKTFLLSFVRYFFVSRILMEIENAGYKISMINTDGFIANIPEKEMNEIYPISKKMGDLKMEVENVSYYIRNVKDTQIIF